MAFSKQMALFKSFKRLFNWDKLSFKKDKDMEEEDYDDYGYGGIVFFYFFIFFYYFFYLFFFH